MEYEKPTILIYDEEVLKELQAMASSKCNCTASGSRVCYEA